MRKFNFTWGVMLAAIVLLAYAFIAFYGELYKTEGNFVWPLVVGLGIVIIVSICVYILVSSKVTKSREIGFVGQLLFGLIIFAVFVMAGIPFSSFLKVVNSKESIDAEISAIKISAVRLDSAYNIYADQRIADYKRMTHGKDADLKVASFQRRLCPKSLPLYQEQRKEWINSIDNMSIWNISLPRNLNVLKTSVEEWTKQYVELSSFSYDGHPINEFSYDEFNDSLTKLLHDLKESDAKDLVWEIIVAILAALIMMLPYWIAIPTPKPDPKRTHINYV